MAIGVAQETCTPATGGMTGSGTTFASSSITVAAGSILVAVAVGVTGTNVTGFSDSVNGGTGWSVAKVVNNAPLVVAMGWRYFSTGQTVTVTATYNATTDHRGIKLLEVTGAVTPGALDGTPAGQFQLNVATTTDAVTSGNLTTSVQPALVIGACMNFGNNNNAATGTGFTSTRVDWNTDVGGCRIEYKRVTATGTQAATYTAPSIQSWITLAIAFDEAPAAGQVPWPPQTTRQSAADSWALDYGGVRRTIATSPKIDAPSPVNPNATTDRIATDAWWPEYGPPLVRRPQVVQQRIDAPSPVNPNLATDRLAAETWAIDYGAARRPMFTAPRVDNPPPIQPLSASDRVAAESWNAEEVRIGRRPALALGAAVASQPTPMGPPNTARVAAETWPIDYGATRKPTWTDGAHDPPPPRAVPPLTAAATWVPDEVVPRLGPRLVQSVDSPPPRGSIASVWTAIESWVVELVRAARVPATDGAHDAPPPYVSRAGAPAATWSPDEQTRTRAPVVPQSPAAAQQVPPARSQAAAAQAWDAPEAPPPARPRFPAPSVDAPPPRTPFARAAVDTWTPEEVRPRPPFAPQPTGSQVDNPQPRGPLATIRTGIETWLMEYGATRRPTFTDGQRDAPPPRTPFARAAADTWAPFEDQRPRSATAPQSSVQADNPPPRGLVATARAAVETWLADYGSVRRPTYTDGQRDQPSPRVPFARAAADSWEVPDTRLPPRYQPQLPTTVNQPPPIGAINTLRAALETWWVSFGWTRPPSFTAPKVDSPPPAATRMGWAAAATWAPDDAQQTAKRTAPPAAPVPDAPPPQASRNAGPAAETWAPVETPRLRAPSAPQASAQVPPASRPSLGAVIESWVAEAVAARRPPAVVPGSVDAPPPRSAAARAVAVAETWLTEIVGLRSRTVVPAGVAPPAPTGNRNTARAAETWTMEGAWVRRPTAPIPPPQVDQPPLSGAKVVRNIAQATWEYVEYARSTWRTIADLAFAWLPAWLVAHPGRSRAYSDVDSQGRPRSYSIVDLSRTDSTLDPSRTYSIVQKTRTED